MMVRVQEADFDVGASWPRCAGIDRRSARWRPSSASCASVSDGAGVSR
jgi:hypothetical protein